jgi:MFS family permease
MATVSTESIDVSTDETLTPYARKALIASVAGFILDGFDLQLLAFVLVAVAADLKLTPVEAGSLVTWTLIGAVIGGSVFGVVSDYVGRVRTLAWSIIVFAVFTGLCAFAQNYWQLAAARTFAGIGLGGEFGIGMALVAEAWPPRLRARGTSYVAIGWQFGILMAAISVGILLPYVGWRGMFAIGIFPAFIAFFIRHAIPEPPLFVAHRARERFPVALLFKDKETTKRSIAMVVLCSVQNFGYYGVLIWLPFYLSNRFGYSLTRSSLWMAVTIIGMASGMFVFGNLADRIGRRPAFFIFQWAAAISVLVYSQLTDQWALLIGGGIMGIFVNGMLGGYGALLSELYPTEARATAQNVLYNAGRVVGSFGPIVIGGLVANYSFVAGTVLLACLYILDFAVTAWGIPELKGKELE